MTLVAGSEQLRRQGITVAKSHKPTPEALETIRRRIMQEIVHAVPLGRRPSRRERMAAYLARRLNQRAKRMR